MNKIDLEKQTKKEEFENSVIDSSVLGMARSQIASIQNHEKTTANSNEYDQGFSPIDIRDYPKHFNPRMAFRFPVSLEGFIKWYREAVQAVHPISNEAFDRINAEHFN